MNVANMLHGRLVHQGRVATLSDRLASLLPTGAKVLDVGCGDGLLALRIQRHRPDVTIEGIDVFERHNAQIPVDVFDGRTIPAGDATYDAVMLVDVLHHTTNQAELLGECGRVAAQHVLIKDHLADGLGTRALLRFMDYVGNRHAGVALPYKYRCHAEWQSIFADADLAVDHWDDRLMMYPRYADWLFGRNLQFCARLTPAHRLASAAHA